jgi:outer membrane receptor protein involved in Fe transport
LSLFAQQAYAQTQEAQFRQLQQCEQNANTAQDKAACAAEQKLTEAQIAQLRADAQFDAAIAAQERSRYIQVADATPNTPSPLKGEGEMGRESKHTNTKLNISSEAIRTAEATDANPAGTSKAAKDKALSKDKGASNKGTNNLPIDIDLKAVEVRAKRFHQIGPLPGLGLTKEEIPGNVQSITAKQIKESHALSIADLMNTHLQSVNVNDYQSNPFQMDVQYRGFTASPQIGTAQGLSVFLDGIRVNEPFGDVVNWDMIPMNALASLDVFPGSNPIFGLGTLGGALSMRTKSGFDSNEGTVEALGGSFNRKQFQGSIGGNNGVIAGFVAANIFREDGWRKNSPSEVNQVFGKAEWRNDSLQLGLSTLYAGNDLIGNGLLPRELLEQDRESVFTSPDQTKNRLMQFQLSGIWDVSDTFNITGQVYRRDSKRNGKNGDVYTDFTHRDQQTRKLRPGENAVCGMQDANLDGVPDYYVDVREPDGFGFGGFNNSDFMDDYFANGVPNYGLLAPDAFNQALPPDYQQRVVARIKQDQSYIENFFATGNGTTLEPIDWPADGTQFYQLDSYFDIFSSSRYYVSEDGKGHFLVTLPTITDTCPDGANSTYQYGEISGLPRVLDSNGDPIYRDGAYLNSAGGLGAGAGVIEGTPTAVITNTQINQITDGASVQFNWNFDKHKLMVGASIDKSRSSYASGQMLGLLDADRNAYLAPDKIGSEYLSSWYEVRANDFDGTSTTKSLYASETWSPVETLHINGSARYNQTKVKNNLAVQPYDFTLAQMKTILLPYVLCPSSDPSSCPSGEEGSYFKPDLSRNLNEKETEKFSYYSLNPSLGVTWQAQPDLNLYSNWSRGTRTPSVIELGCAYDGTMGTWINNDNYPEYGPRSLVEERFCSLPSTMSGDPYLPQVKAQTFELGGRGQLWGNLEWNLSAYRTDLKDDIYFVSFTNERSFFQSIGETRRQGIEAGVTGTIGKSHFKVNYALTDATFEDSFKMLSAHNSSAVRDASSIDNQQITVNPGARMPGVPLHNLNASFSYDVTDKWNLGLTAVMHSSSYVRGNENNKHRPGTENIVTNVGDGYGSAITLTRQPFNNPGKVPGFTVFNLRSSYKLDKGLTLGLQVNNLFNREYFTAGRLGVNPFSPSINGAIGPSGYNHNSNDWQNTNFLSPSAPRSAFLTLTYDFDVGK